MYSQRQSSWNQSSHPPRESSQGDNYGTDYKRSDYEGDQYDSQESGYYETDYNRSSSSEANVGEYSDQQDSGYYQDSGYHQGSSYYETYEHAPVSDSNVKQTIEGSKGVNPRDPRKRSYLYQERESERSKLRKRETIQYGYKDEHGHEQYDRSSYQYSATSERKSVSEYEGNKKISSEEWSRSYSQSQYSRNYTSEHPSPRYQHDAEPSQSYQPQDGRETRTQQTSSLYPSASNNTPQTNPRYPSVSDNTGGTDYNRDYPSKDPRQRYQYGTGWGQYQSDGNRESMTSQSRTRYPSGTDIDTPGNQGHSTPVNQGNSTPGNQGHSTPGNQGHSTPGNQGHSTPGNQGHSTPGNQGHSTPGNQGHSTPGNQGHSTPGNQGYSVADSSKLPLTGLNVDNVVKKLDLSSIQLDNLKSIFDKIQSPTTPISPAVMPLTPSSSYQSQSRDVEIPFEKRRDSAETSFSNQSDLSNQVSGYSSDSGYQQISLNQTRGYGFQQGSLRYQAEPDYRQNPPGQSPQLNYQQNQTSQPLVYTLPESQPNSTNQTERNATHQTQQQDLSNQSTAYNIPDSSRLQNAPNTSQQMQLYPQGANNSQYQYGDPYPQHPQTPLLQSSQYPSPPGLQNSGQSHTSSYPQSAQTAQFPQGVQQTQHTPIPQHAQGAQNTQYAHSAQAQGYLQPLQNSQYSQSGQMSQNPQAAQTPTSTIQPSYLQNPGQLLSLPGYQQVTNTTSDSHVTPASTFLQQKATASFLSHVIESLPVYQQTAHSVVPSSARHQCNVPATQSESNQQKVADLELMRTLTSNADFSFTLNPAPPMDTTVHVKKLNSGDIFTVTNNRLEFKDSAYEDRILYTGTSKRGVFKFTLKQCKYEDEGRYMAYYKGIESEKRHLKISTGIQVKIGSEVLFRWSIDPGMASDIVFVYHVVQSIRKLVLMARGTAAAISEEYYSRVKFSGNTFQGIIQFLLSNCITTDFGMYISVCNDKETKGRQLFIKSSDIRSKPKVTDSVVLLGQEVTMTWYIQPVNASSAIVGVKRKGGKFLLTATHTCTFITKEFEGRIKFLGNMKQGIVSYKLMKCTYKDEGPYVTEAFNKESPGPKLEIATLVAVKANTNAEFYWSTKPLHKEVKICKLNGPVLFIIHGDKVDIKEAYKSRISYRGNVSVGLIHFTISKCTMHDRGYYTAYSNGGLHGGKLLQVEVEGKEPILQQSKNNPGLLYAIHNGTSTFSYSEYCIINEMSYNIQRVSKDDTAYDSSVLSLRIKEGETAFLCWQIKPVAEDVMVKVYKDKESPIFIASGNMAIEHSNRVKFTGNMTTGMIEFMLFDCTPEDSGIYRSSRDMDANQGKSLRVIGSAALPDVKVLWKDDIILRWQVEGAGEKSEIEVYKKDGKTLFFVTGNNLIKTEEDYKGRVEFTGDITAGVLMFKISYCQFSDEGVYMARDEEFDFVGPKLLVELPSSDDVDVTLGETARIKFYIKPQTKQVLVSIYKDSKDIVFTVYGDKAYYIDEALKHRLNFIGDATEGRIDFSLEHCNFQDQGDYSASISDGSDKMFKGVKLTTNVPPPEDVHVTLDSCGFFKWYIKPVPPKPNTSTVTVHFVNGPTLFTVYGDNVYITAAYQNRIEYMGDVTKGIVQFKLRNCLYRDEGQFAASYDGSVYPGPKMILRIPVIPDITAPLSDSAAFKWFMKPPPEGAWVTVSNRDGETLFVVMGKFTDIRERYKDRLKISGDISLGVIEFVLDSCNYGDEGTYVVSYKDKQFVGPKLNISLAVNDREPAPISWRIRPVPQGGFVKVLRKNGLHVFTAIGNTIEVTEEYRDRVLFNGDTRTGKIQFVLKDCSYGDTGLYISSYNEIFCDGRYLKVKLLDEETEKQKHLLKLKLMIVAECLKVSKKADAKQMLDKAAVTAELRMFCNYETGATTFPSFNKSALVPQCTGFMYVGDSFQILLTYAFGKNEDEVKEEMCKKAVNILITKNIDEIINVEHVKPADVATQVLGIQQHTVQYYYKTSVELFQLLSSLSSVESRRVFSKQLVEDPNVKDDTFAKAARLMYDCKRISLLDILSAVKQREIQKHRRSMRAQIPPTLGTLLSQTDVHTNVLELTKLDSSKSETDFVLFDYEEEKQRLLGAFNCLTECAKKCGILILWSTKLVYGNYTTILPRPVYRCTMWIQGKQIAEAFSIGRKFSIQLAAAEALAYLYQSQPVIQKVECETANMYQYSAGKVLKEADLLNKDLSLNERVLLVCEKVILQYKKENEGTLDSLEFHPGLQEHVYTNIKRICASHNLVCKTSLSPENGPVLTVSQNLDPYQIVTILGQHNGTYGKYRLIPAVERVQIAREIVMKARNVIELFPEDHS